MKQRLLSPLALLLCLSSAIAAPQSNSEEAKDQLNRGIQDFKAGQYESAVEHFKQAHQLDPQSRRATLYLAASLAEGYIPGVETPDNLNLAIESIAAYKEVLALDSQNLNALKSIAGLEFQMRKFEEANSYYRKAAQAGPNDAETLYSIGVVDWVQAYKGRAEERKKRGLPMDGPPSFTQLFCPKLRAANLPLIEDGMQALNKAIELEPGYDDAMAYMNLLLRERAEIECNNKAARSRDEKQADQWVSNAMEAKARRHELPKEKQEELPPEEPRVSEDLDPPPAFQPPPPPPPPPPPRPR